MPDTFIPLSEVEWVEQLVCDRYKVKVPKFLVDAHKWWGWWEKERFASMEKNLKQRDILFDIGAETGWISAIYAQFVGAENMCLFEPTPEVWPTIKATWKENDLPTPLYACWGLVSNVDGPPMPVTWGSISVRGWPACAYDKVLLENVKYNHIDEDAHHRPQITLDRFIEVTGIQPSAITIDVEGAELLVLQGAKNTLQTVRPLVWVSLHEGLTRPGVEPKNQDVINFMAKQGYDGTLLGVDHETHYLFRP